MAYYTLLNRTMHYGRLSNWCIQFGDFDPEVVKQEMSDRFEDDQDDSVMMKIIKTEDESQAIIEEIIRILNKEIGP